MSNTNNIHKQVASEQYCWFFTTVAMEQPLFIVGDITRSVHFDNIYLESLNKGKRS